MDAAVGFGRALDGVFVGMRVGVGSIVAAMRVQRATSVFHTYYTWLWR